MARAKKSLTLEPKLIQLVRKHVASGSIGASTARGMGKGTVKAAREFLQTLDLQQFVMETEEAFNRHFNKITKQFSKKLLAKRKLPGKRWGAARKFLNIFLRGTLYNHYLREHYRLDIIEPFLEVPLDKSVATGLQGEEEGSLLPRWRGVIHLSEGDSAKYQAVACRVAQRKGCSPVHLDLWYYRRNEFDGKHGVS